MQRRVRRPFSWWTVPVGLSLWAVAVWAAGLVRVWGAPLSSGSLRVQVAAGPLALVGTLVAALAFVVFADHLRRARGLSR